MSYSCVSHSADLDGVASAILANFYLKTLHHGAHVNVVFTSVNGDAENAIISAIQDSSVIWITDLSFSNENFLSDLFKFHPDKAIHVFDHHASSQQAFQNVSSCNAVLDISGNKCATDLVYDYIKTRIGCIPAEYCDLVRYTHSIDLWIKDEPQGERLTEVIQNLGAKETFNLLTQDISKIYLENFTPAMQLCNKISDRNLSKSSSLAFNSVLEEKTDTLGVVKAAFCYGCASEVGSALVQGEKAWVGLIDMSRQELSFRTNNETVNLTGIGANDIAKFLGGGGHPNAAGSKCTKEILLGGPAILKQEMVKIISKIKSKT